MDETCSTLTSYQGLFPVEKQTFLDMKFRGITRPLDSYEYSPF
jgi:hypothetical protein